MRNTLVALILFLVSAVSAAAQSFSSIGPLGHSNINVIIAGSINNSSVIMAAGPLMGSEPLESAQPSSSVMPRPSPPRSSSAKPNHLQLSAIDLIVYPYSPTIYSFIVNRPRSLN